MPELPPTPTPQSSSGNPMIPPPPQANRPLVRLPSVQEDRLLGRALEADRADHFANDADEQVRRLGRLALRRIERDADDYFLLGDMCAILSFNKSRLLVLYIGKTLMAYRRAAQLARSEVQIALSERVIEEFIRWTQEVAALIPTPRNLAAALWAASEIALDQQLFSTVEGSLALIRQFEKIYTESLTSKKQGFVPSINGQVDFVGQGGLEPSTLRPAPSVPKSRERETMEMKVISPSPSPTLASQTLEHSIVEPPESIPEPPPELSDSLPQAELFAIPNSADDVFHDDENLTGVTLDETDAEGIAHFAPYAARVPVNPETETETFTTTEFFTGEVIDDPYDRNKHYLVERVLRGGMGVVYICKMEGTKSRLAIKTFQGRFLENETARGRFEQEALTWIRLEKHPNVVQARKVQLLGSIRVPARPHILLEYVQGESGIGADLENSILQDRLDLAMILRVGISICRGMEHATRMIPNLVHRDLKPANILIRDDGQVKVTDFGLASSISMRYTASETGEIDDTLDGEEVERLTRAGAVVGTAAYLSPEQARSAETDQRSDIYSFGAILYEMLTRQPIYKARTLKEWVQAHQFGTVEFPSDIVDHVPNALKALTLQCLAKNASDRPASWTELLGQLVEIYQDVMGEEVHTASLSETLELDEVMDKAYGLTELRQYGEALIAYDRAIQLAPDSAWVWSRRARLLRLLNRFPDALEAVNRALDIEPKFGWAWRQQGFILRELHQYDAAIQAYEQAAIYSSSPEQRLYALQSQATLYGWMNRPAQAKEVLEEVLELSPRDALSWAKLSRMRRLAGETASALDASEASTRLAPHEASAWNERGLVLSVMNRHAEAVSMFARAVREEPRNVWYRFNHAGALINIAQIDEALDVLDEALDLDPTHMRSWLRRGLALRRVGRFKEALNAYDEALHLDPNDAWTWNFRGLVLEEMDRREEALASYERAASLMPTNPSFTMNQVDPLLALRRYDDALDRVEATLALTPRSNRAWARKGQIFRLLGQYEGALNAYNKAVEIDSQDRWSWIHRGHTFGALGRTEAALESYKSAALVEPQDATMWYIYGEALFDMARYAESIHAFNHALEIDPRHSAAIRKRTEARKKITS